MRAGRKNVGEIEQRISLVHILYGFTKVDDVGCIFLERILKRNNEAFVFSFKLRLLVRSGAHRDLGVLVVQFEIFVKIKLHEFGVEVARHVWRSSLEQTRRRYIFWPSVRRLLVCAAKNGKNDSPE